jgi:hypothetical protein
MMRLSLLACLVQAVGAVTFAEKSSVLNHLSLSKDTRGNGVNLGDAHASLRSAMTSMMQDDDDISDEEYQKSASELSQSLGAGWNGEEIEAKADRAKHNLLDGIANPRQVQALTAMLGGLTGNLLR